MNDKVEYDAHADEWDKILAEGSSDNIGNTWNYTDNLDYWRHQRMYKFALPVIETAPNASWLTVGDGRYGRDGIALKRLGAKSITCTDMSATLLKRAKELQLIEEYSEQNAEKMTFDDDEFDFIFCKESFHHFPRPFNGLHELKRVARCGVILIEPRDLNIDRSPLHFILKFINYFASGKILSHKFEPVGNYVFQLSLRETEKFLLGIHCTEFAYFELNDAYTKGIEFVHLDSQKYNDVLKKISVKGKIFLQNILSFVGIMKPRLLGIYIPNEELTVVKKQLLTNQGWKIMNLPKNPFKK